MQTKSLDVSVDGVRVNKHRRDWRGWKFMWPFALVFVFVFVIPLAYAVQQSFYSHKLIGGDVFAGFSNYQRLFADEHFWSAVGRVTVFTAIQVPLTLVLATLLALAIDSMRLHGTKFFRISTFMPYAVPAVVSTLMWGFIYGSKYGLVASVNGFLGTHFNLLGS
ncbi:MAG: sugar ABC transporter permease, partial [Bifidobacteriaceae bacterium]|nr:sugar ABC transporter permease [Bifidobacteriaceae bacterium]